MESDHWSVLWPGELIRWCCLNILWWPLTKYLRFSLTDGALSVSGAFVSAAIRLPDIACGSCVFAQRRDAELRTESCCHVLLICQTITSSIDFAPCPLHFTPLKDCRAGDAIDLCLPDWPQWLSNWLGLYYISWFTTLDLTCYSSLWHSCNKTRTWDNPSGRGVMGQLEIGPMTQYDNTVGCERARG